MLTEPKNRTQQSVFIKGVKSLKPHFTEKKFKKIHRLSTGFNDICHHARKILHKTETKQKLIQRSNQDLSNGQMILNIFMYDYLTHVRKKLI